MPFKGLRSKRYWNLVRTRDERPLTEKENDFLLEYSESAPSEAVLAELESEAMQFFREQSLEPAPTDHLTSVISRKWAMERKKSAFGYWFPAVAGASITAVAVLAILQILTNAGKTTEATWRDAEARRMSNRSIDFPDPRVFSPRPIDR